MEFDPSISRSILGDPRSPNMQKNLNLKVKHRESFRPFALSFSRRTTKWFKIIEQSLNAIVAEIIDRKN